MSFKNYIPRPINRLAKALWRLNHLLPEVFFQKEANDKIGNLQKDEAVFLYSLLKVIRPKLVVEFGFLNGYSASVILSALDNDASLHSYDISDYAKARASKFSKTNSRFFYHHKSQADFALTDLGSEALIDFVLIDASHDLEINKTTFEKLKPCLATNALVMVHDTGLWQKSLMQPAHADSLKFTQHKWLDKDRLAHQVCEREFVNWIIKNESEFNILHFGSSAVLRHGFSLIGRKRLLEV